MNKPYLRFWGVRGSYPAPFSSHLKVGGNTSCVEINYNDQVLICDGGTGIIPLGNSLLGQSAIREVTILMTHYHWDHISGLPFFVPAFVPGWKVNFFGPSQNGKDIEKSLGGQMQNPYFPVELETWMAETNYLELNSNNQVIWGDFKITPFNVHHPGTTFGYRIDVGDKSIVYVSDNELYFIEQNLKLRANELDPEELEILNAMLVEERQSALNILKDVDIFIHDAQYTPADYQKKRGWGHSCYLDTVDYAIEAGVKDLYLFHVDPAYNDDKMEDLHRDALRLISERNAPLQCHLAREGSIIELA
jgi:phosphoribosyl 1,2-cyclic phosphodiesterase